jgi:uncharacterized protein (UPF0210 family)
MKIRSITYFSNPVQPNFAESLSEAGDFSAAAREEFTRQGYEVQTTRLATTPISTFLDGHTFNTILSKVCAIEGLCTDLGIDYVSLGPALPNNRFHYELIPALLEATESAFFSGIMTLPHGGVSLSAVRACADVIITAAPVSADGFANLRFAALANVPPGSPFFPAAYHQGNQASFALALEAADLAVTAFSEASDLKTARQSLIAAMNKHAQKLSYAAETLSNRFGVRYGGIDFSLAPYPDAICSLGAALEHLGGACVGKRGSVAAAAVLADTIDQAEFPRAGFSGLMLPVLEDSVLAERAAQGVLDLKDLLLYSAVCGTGLDTVPLPGDTTANEITPLLLDLAALSQRLNKPLTARLMPIPGKSAGDETGFNFEYFANSRVMAIDAEEISRHMSSDEDFYLSPRKT